MLPCRCRNKINCQSWRTTTCSCIHYTRLWNYT